MRKENKLNPIAYDAGKTEIKFTQICIYTVHDFGETCLTRTNIIIVHKRIVLASLNLVF